MPKHLPRAIILLACTGALLAPADAQARTVPAKFSSCTGLLKKYPAGVAASKSKRKGTKATVSALVYTQNKALDLDGNGIACDSGDLEAATWSSFTLKGEGADTKELAIPAGKPAIITFTHDGEETFTAATLDSDEMQIDQLVSAVGAYRGTVFVGRGEESSPTVAKSLDIYADGAWTAKVAPVTTAPLFSSTKSGTGDAVLRHKGAATQVKVTHEGEEAFAVTVFTSKGFYVDVMVSEEGAVDTTFDLPADCYIAINADGDWKLAK